MRVKKMSKDKAINLFEIANLRKKSGTYFFIIYKKSAKEL